eukprot:CAMPEP_0117802282 /NCGR_PEP_ID=MMETSP0948-20121206/15636_1 /TAXON_ID=44440 /ORGANISM="Chattonella subsalsa, Strain CCMP2191" /LENGTH=111 /DNA_ID=CAMNT_0005635049 /DNA_START=1560 /DNA_END=1895 /DNA_ORIENTATION=-
MGVFLVHLGSGPRGSALVAAARPGPGDPPFLGPVHAPCPGPDAHPGSARGIQVFAPPTLARVQAHKRRGLGFLDEVFPDGEPCRSDSPASFPPGSPMPLARRLFAAWFSRA